GEAGKGSEGDVGVTGRQRRGGESGQRHLAAARRRRRSEDRIEARRWQVRERDGVIAAGADAGQHLIDLGQDLGALVACVLDEGDLLGAGEIGGAQPGAGDGAGVSAGGGGGRAGRRGGGGRRWIDGAAAAADGGGG